MPLQTYTIKSGDNLAIIAKRFRFASWKPIWNYNTKVRKPPKPFSPGDPNRLFPGVWIYIPMTENEYKIKIAAWERHYSETRRETDKNLGEFEKYQRHYKLWATSVDLTADVLMSVKGGVKASLKISKRLMRYKWRKQIILIAKDILLKTPDLLENIMPNKIDINSRSKGEDDISKTTNKAAFDTVSNNSILPQAGMIRHGAKRKRF